MTETKVKPANHKTCFICNEEKLATFILQKGSYTLFFCNINCYKKYLNNKSN